MTIRVIVDKGLQRLAEAYVEVLVDIRSMHHILYLVSSTGYHALCEESVKKKQRVNERCGLLRDPYWLGLTCSIVPVCLA
jgi:hypothetical protein